MTSKQEKKIIKNRVYYDLFINFPLLSRSNMLKKSKNMIIHIKKPEADCSLYKHFFVFHSHFEEGSNIEKQKKEKIQIITEKP